MKLHSTDAGVLVELWSGIKNYVPAKDQRACADHFITSIDEAGIVDIGEASDDLYGVCDVFDKALREFYIVNGYSGDDDDDWEE